MLNGAPTEAEVDLRKSASIVAKQRAFSPT